MSDKINLNPFDRSDGSWVAIDADNYEAECDSTGWWSKSPAGYERRLWQSSENLKQAQARIEALEAALREIADLASHHGVSARAFIDITNAALAEGQDK